MNKLLISNLVLIVIILFLLLSGFQTEEREGMENVLEVIDQNPMAQKFLQAYPRAKVQGYFISEGVIEKEIEEIRQDCGDGFEKQGYWKFQYTDVKENKSMTLWVDPETRETVCMVQEILNQDIVIPLGIKQNREELKVRKGSEFGEALYFYNINGNTTYYVKVDILERPSFRVEMEPMVQRYNPMDRDPVDMNVKVEPSELKMAEPEKHPPDEKYIQIEGIEGYVMAKSVGFRFYSPKPKPYEEYPQEKYNFRLNVSAIYYKGMRSYHYDSWLVNYTIILT
ncbi:MAG: hypothetical protein JSV92_02615 [archaeon]|nr:MAG: hypothetical protein JSV92_02615 [archaeon]